MEGAAVERRRGRSRLVARGGRIEREDGGASSAAISPSEGAPEPGAVRVEYMPLGALLRAPRNPKGHDLWAVAASTRRFGFVAPLVMDDRTGRLVAGHGRLETLQGQKASGEAPPARVKVGPDGDWLVPVVRGVAFKDDKEAEAYLLADNQTTALGAWDESSLAAMLQDLAADRPLEGTGFQLEDMNELLRKVTGIRSVGADPGPHTERWEELAREWATAPGQLWTVPSIAVPGQVHRLLCGDCTLAADVDRLLGESIANGKPVSPDAVLTDPPYCSGGFQEAGRKAGSKGTDVAYRKIANDTLSTRGYQALMKNALGISRGGICYVFTDWRMWVMLFDVVESCGFGVRNMIVWDKGSPGMGQGWRAQHELVLFGTRTEQRFNGKLAVGNVVQVGRSGNIHHATEKPVDLLRTLLRVADFARTVYDPFAGSGSTVVAAEMEGRTAFGMELDPGYLAVGLERLKAMGLSPERVQ
jgi:DNA modification methylase